MKKLDLCNKKAVKRRIKTLRKVVTVKTKEGVINYSSHRLVWLELRTLQKRLGK
jgi:hypothetical protein